MFFRRQLATRTHWGENFSWEMFEDLIGDILAQEQSLIRIAQIFRQAHQSTMLITNILGQNCTTPLFGISLG